MCEVTYDRCIVKEAVSHSRKEGKEGVLETDLQTRVRRFRKDTDSTCTVDINWGCKSKINLTQPDQSRYRLAEDERCEKKIDETIII